MQMFWSIADLLLLEFQLFMKIHIPDSGPLVELLQVPARVSSLCQEFS